MEKNQTNSKQYNLLIVITAIIFGVCTLLGYASAKPKSNGFTDADLEPIELLGKYVFFDKISDPPRMACVTCHDPKTGGTGSVSGVNLHQVAITGANPHKVGNLKPPTNAYASLILPIGPCGNGVPGICGGNFWNARAIGAIADSLTLPPPPPPPNNAVVSLAGATKHIGDEVFFNTDGTSLTGAEVLEYADYFGPTADQALNPMPNTVEQNIERKAVCEHVRSSKYAELYFNVWGVEIDCSDDPVEVSSPDVDDPPEKAFDISFKRLMLAVCAWQASLDLNSFTSKRDIALAADEDKAFPFGGFTDEENLGHDLFYGTNESGLNIGGPDGDPKDARCAACHLSSAALTDGTDPDERYADDGFHNIGTPRNPEIPETFDANGDPIDPDLGLAGLTGVMGQNDGDISSCGGFSRNCDHRGFVRTPTLRNVNKRKGNGFVKAYTHNGWFKSMESIVHFYNTADVEGATAEAFGVTRCPEGIETEKDALANNCWPAPAYDTAQIGSPAIGALLGDLGLTLEEEAAIVAYMKTLTDEHTAKAPKPYKPAKKGKKR